MATQLSHGEGEDMYLAWDSHSTIADSAQILTMGYMWESFLFNK